MHESTKLWLQEDNQTNSEIAVADNIQRCQSGQESVNDSTLQVSRRSTPGTTVAYVYTMCYCTICINYGAMGGNQYKVLKSVPAACVPCVQISIWIISELGIPLHADRPCMLSHMLIHVSMSYLSLQVAPSQYSPNMPTPPALYTLTAVQVLELLKTNTITVEAYAQSLLDRIHDRDDIVKAWAHLGESCSAHIKHFI